MYKTEKATVKIKPSWMIVLDPADQFLGFN